MTPDESRAMFLEETPPLYREIIERSFDGTGSKRNAIKGFCLACVGFVRADVENCTAWTCPLHAYRPRYGQDPQKRGSGAARSDETPSAGITLPCQPSDALEAVLDVPTEVTA